MKKIIYIIIILLSILFLMRYHTAIAESPEKYITLTEYAEMRVSDTFGENQWESFDNIIKKESRWDCNAQNPKSSAYGLGQLLDSTHKWLEFEKTDDCMMQVDYAITYIQKVYKTPVNAWATWQKQSWY